MERTISVSAPGKIHLIGEHSVVYGAPAILSAIDKRVKITLKTRNDSTVTILFPGPPEFNSEPVLNSTQESGMLKRVQHDTSIEEIISFTISAKELFEAYQKSLDPDILQQIAPDAVSFVKIAIGESLSNLEFKIQNSELRGFTMEIFSQILLGSGLGSSAAIAVSVAAAIEKLLGQSFDTQIINTIAFEIEKRKHGFPSGADNAACTFGGVVWCERKKGRLTVDQLPYTVFQKIPDNFVIVNTGRPKETTGEMVHEVHKLFVQDEALKNKFLESQTTLAHEMVESFQTGDIAAVIRIIRKTQQNLEMIGVVSKLTTQLIRAIEKSGGAAKICGAGGKAQGSGIVLAWHKNPDAIADIADDFGMEVGNITLGEEGVQIENLEFRTQN